MGPGSAKTKFSIIKTHLQRGTTGGEIGVLTCKGYAHINYNNILQSVAEQDRIIDTGLTYGKSSKWTNKHSSLSVSSIKILINFKSGRAKIFPTADDTPISLVLPPINLIYAFLAFFWILEASLLIQGLEPLGSIHFGNRPTGSANEQTLFLLALFSLSFYFLIDANSRSECEIPFARLN